MEKEETNFFSAFDSSIGWLCDGCVYFWENRWGGKTFVKSNGKGIIEFAIACSSNGQIAINQTPLLDEIRHEYGVDGEPAFHPATHDDLVMLISALVGSFVIVPDFIDRFLTPGRVLSDPEKDEFDEYYHGAKDVPTEAKQYIRSMKYADFLLTPYWKEISSRVKMRRNNRCQLCGSTKGLEVHHSDYSIHGDEINNIDKLTVLCHKCHAKFHDKMK